MKILKLWTKMALRQWPRRLTLLLTAALLVYLGIKYFDVSNPDVSKMSEASQNLVKKFVDKNVVNIDDIVNIVPTNKATVSTPIGQIVNLEIFHDGKCPACFGDSMCSVLEHGLMQLYETGEIQKQRQDKIVRNGLLKANDRLSIVTPTPNDWVKFDEFICLNASETLPCDVPSAARRGFLTSRLALEIIENGGLMPGKSRTNVVAPCSSPKYQQELQKAFDDNGDGTLSPDEQARLLTALLMYPGYAVMKFQTRSGITMPFPSLRGACGRHIIYEGGLVPLKNYLKESFEVRASLAVQLIQMIEDFQEEDSQWYFFYTDFSTESLAVTVEGEVVLVTLDDMLIVEKSLFPPSTVVNILQKHQELCNEVCFQKFTRELLAGPNAPAVCAQLPYYGQLMFAVMCKQVLSNLDEHHTEGFFNFDGNKIHKKPEHKGLLHSIPFKDRETVEDLLRECVQETSAGGRKQAIEELRDILEGYLNYEEDQDGEDEGEHEENIKNDSMADPQGREYDDAEIEGGNDIE